MFSSMESVGLILPQKKRRARTYQKVLASMKKKI
nr:MAG TPA: hypothetical protein [Caudoviricetes sp.]